MEEYQLVEIDLTKLKNDISSPKETRLLWDIGNDKKLDMTIYPSDIRSSSYTEIIVSDNKQSVGKNEETVTYRGHLRDGYWVALTIDEDFIYGGFQTDKGVLMVQQLKYFLSDKNIANSLLVVYEADKVKEKEGMCATPNDLAIAEDGETVTPKSTSSGCKIVEVALDCDTEYWNIYNDNSFNMMLGEINMIQNMYENDVNAILSVTSSHVIIGSPYVSTNGNTIINEIKNLWSSSSFNSIPRDLVHHFTGKDTGPLGQASQIGGACVESNPVCWTENRINSHQTVAHEIGHLLNGRHEDGTNCGTPFVRSIMCQGLDKQLTFSPASRTRITNFITPKACFNMNTAVISGSDGVCINNNRTYTLTNFQPTAGTTITWSVNNRLTILSGQGTKTVVVRGVSNGTGVINAVLNYPGTCGSITETKNILVGPPIITIAISGPNSSGDITATASGGTPPYTWTLNNNTTWTTTSATTSRYVGCNGGYLYVQSSNSCGSGSGSAFIQPCSGGFYSVVVYPNPTKNEINVKKNRDSNLRFESNLELTLYDFSGSTVKVQKYSAFLEELQLNVADLKKGIYFLRVSTKDINEVHQIFID